MAQFLWYDCTLQKQCTVPVTLTIDIWMSIYKYTGNVYISDRYLF